MQRAMPLGQHAFGCLLAVGMTVGVLAGPAGATQAQRLSGLDLRLGPKDVAPPTEATPLPSAPEDADPQDQNLPEIVGEIRLFPATAVLAVGVLLSVLAAAHLVSLLTGTPLHGRYGP